MVEVFGLKSAFVIDFLKIHMLEEERGTLSK